MTSAATLYAVIVERAAVEDDVFAVVKESSEIFSEIVDRLLAPGWDARELGRPSFAIRGIRTPASFPKNA